MKNRIYTLVSTLLFILLAVLVFVVPDRDLKWVIAVGAPVLFSMSLVSAKKYSRNK